MPQVATVIGAVATVAGTVMSVQGQRKAYRAQRQQQELATRRSRRMAIREAQIRRAQATATAQGTGALESSGAAGGIGALSSQLGEQLGFSTAMSGLSRRIMAGQYQAQLGGDIATLGAAGYKWGTSKAKNKPTTPAAATPSTPYYQQSPYGF